ncbi:MULTISPECIES: hypothetical protein [unclassified Rhodococcus (in: high G+C Gram-positive bacteria)]|jgi:hypothetical protein|uniref:hypothetical protein n=1 Tax=unclassified Rhodococcus (in: high G+C Gram-positive bacteria) TaxID=192944 RepID=UPI000B062C1D|nr:MULTISPECIES: hypothetical protein [unclassified Rhodococcus (in: high G+C Gram-positive bacteria)]MDQ1179356.1 hypothetical protein [Rhodococcus sp. SORGH_AS_0301]MDQ1200648.1 hypothetical protein [Rhodococcus sp. SORGH_AS_0303]
MAPSHDITRSASAPSTTASRRPTKNTPFECAAALFSYDFVSGGVDYDTLESLHRGEVTEWTSALRRSGLFTDAEMDALAAQWSERPGLLLDALLRDADEMTVRRCRLAWSAMDRLAPFQMPIAHSG